MLITRNFFNPNSPSNAKPILLGTALTQLINAVHDGVAIHEVDQNWIEIDGPIVGTVVYEGTKEEMLPLYTYVTQKQAEQIKKRSAA